MINLANLNYKWDGYYVLNIFNRSLNRLVRRKIVQNTITDLAKTELAKSLLGLTPNLEIKYLAIGTGTASTSSGDTKLVNEVFRCADEGLESIGNGVIQSSFTIYTTDYNGAVEEVGIFGGTSAAGTVDTGTLISRILLHETKSAEDDWYFQRLDILGG